MLHGVFDSDGDKVLLNSGGVKVKECIFFIGVKGLGDVNEFHACVVHGGLEFREDVENFLLSGIVLKLCNDGLNVVINVVNNHHPFINNWANSLSGGIEGASVGHVGKICF